VARSEPGVGDRPQQGDPSRTEAGLAILDPSRTGFGFSIVVAVRVDGVGSDLAILAERMRGGGVVALSEGGLASGRIRRLIPETRW
jgi:hypothetical protein